MDVTMPQLGETVAEATLTRWLHKGGDPVTEGEPLFEVSTDKVDTEIPATATGTLTEILVEAGRTVPVGTRLAVIGTGPVVASAEARHGTLSPLVRRLLTEHELTVDQVIGTGPGGRITRADVLTAADAVRTAPEPTPVAEPAPPSAPPAPKAPAAITVPTTVPGQTLTVPFSTRRRLTAEHMVRSKATSPHTLMAIEVDFHNVDRVRRPVAKAWREAEGFSLTYLPFVARAVVDALAAFPHLNASVGDNALLVHRRINLGIAVDLDADGLVVPVVKDAGDKRLRATAREISALAAGARGNRLGPDAYAEGTFTISNPGPYGTLLTAPIINQPQVAILATDAVRPRPVAVPVPDGNHAVVVHPVGNLALTFDHRAVDGGYAARFLAFLKAAVETRDWSTEL